MPCDALSYFFVTNELNQILGGGKIEKINMPEFDEVYLSIRANKQNYLVVISAGATPRIHLTKTVKDNPLTPPAFCMNLRKNINGGIIKKIYQQPFERVIFFDILFKNDLGIREDKTLVCEIMGKYSNIILIDQNQKIIQGLKNIPLDVSAKRQVLPGLKYSLIEQSKFAATDFDLIKGLDFSTDEYQTILKNVKGLAPSAILEVVYKCQLNNGSLPYSEKIAYELNNLYTLPVSPCVLLNDTKSDFFIRKYNSLSGEYKFFDSFSEAMDFLYSMRDQKNRLAAKSKSLSTILKNTLKRAQKRLSEFFMRIDECLNCDEDKIRGELITSNIFRIKHGDTLLKAENYYENGDQILIALDSTLSPAQNAQRYYKKYSKKKRTLAATQQQIEKVKSEILILEELIFCIENIQSPKELNDIADEMAEYGFIKPQKKQKNEKQSQPYKALCCSYTILIGKNNIQNDRLVKNANKFDVWLHAKNVHGSHVIVQCANAANQNNMQHHQDCCQKSLNDATTQLCDTESDLTKAILIAAEYAAYYSGARQGGKVEVDYTYVKYVSKPNQNPPGKVVYTNQKTLVVQPKPLTEPL